MMPAPGQSSTDMSLDVRSSQAQKDAISAVGIQMKNLAQQFPVMEDRQSKMQL